MIRILNMDNPLLQMSLNTCQVMDIMNGAGAAGRSPALKLTLMKMLAAQAAACCRIASAECGYDRAQFEAELKRFLDTAEAANGLSPEEISALAAKEVDILSAQLEAKKETPH